MPDIGQSMSWYLARNQADHVSGSVEEKERPFTTFAYTNLFDILPSSSRLMEAGRSLRSRILHLVLQIRERERERERERDLRQYNFPVVPSLFQLLFPLSLSFQLQGNLSRCVHTRQGREKNYSDFSPLARKNLFLP